MNGREKRQRLLPAEQGGAPAELPVEPPPVPAEPSEILRIQAPAISPLPMYERFIADGAPNFGRSPPMRRVGTPDCMSSPVSHLRNLTRNMQEDARRVHAAQYLKESREQHLQQRKLFLVLDLDETLVHSLRSSVRHLAAAPATAGTVPSSTGMMPSLDQPANESEEREKAIAVAAATVAAAAMTEKHAATATNLHISDEEVDAGTGGPSEAPLQSQTVASMERPKSACSTTHVSRSDASTVSSDAADTDRIAPAPIGSPDSRSVTLTVQNVQFEMQLRPGVHAFLKEMSSLFCVYLYTMGSREYVQQALRHLDPTHEIFRPGQVLAWNPALDRTTKTLRRLLCQPHLVTVVDDSTLAWAQHLPNLLPIDRFTGDLNDNSLALMAERLREIHATFFAQQLEAGKSNPRADSQIPPAFTLNPSDVPLAAPAPQGPSQTIGSTATMPAGSSITKASPLSRGARVSPMQQNGASAVARTSSLLASSASTSAAQHRSTPPQSSLSTTSTANITPLPLAPLDSSRNAERPIASVNANVPAALSTGCSTRAPADTNGTSDAGNGVSTHSSPLPDSHIGPVGGSAADRNMGDEIVRSTPLRPTSPLSPSVDETDAPAAPSALDVLGEETDGPDVRTIIKAMSEKVLEGVVCVFGGPTDVLAGEARPPEVVLAERFGARIESMLTTETTHLLLPPALLDPRSVNLCSRTDAIFKHAHTLGIEERLHRVDLRWLLACVAYWKRLPESEWSAAAMQFVPFV